jgi:hypothetical protein
MYLSFSNNLNSRTQKKCIFIGKRSIIYYMHPCLYIYIKLIIIYNLFLSSIYMRAYNGNTVTKHTCLKTHMAKITIFKDCNI